MSNKRLQAPKVEAAVEKAIEIATSYNHQYVTLEHILSGLMGDDEVRSILEGVGADLKEIEESLDTFFKSSTIPTTARPPRQTAAIHKAVQRAVTNVLFTSRTELLPRDLLVTLLQEEDTHAAYFIQKAGATLPAIKEYITNEVDEDGESISEDAEALAGMAGSEPEQKGKMTPKKAKAILEKYCVNLNEKAGEGGIDPLIGRESEVELLTRIVARRTKNNAVLVGEPGVGKTAIAEGLAKLIVEDSVPEILKDSTVYSLDIGALLAGTKFRGDFEERMKQVLKALEIVDHPILFIDEIHMVMGAGGGSAGSVDVANLLKPALAKGNLKCIGSTTYEEFRKHFEKDRALVRRFQKIDVQEPTNEAARRILEGLKGYYEEFHGVTYTAEALDAAVELTSRYVHDRHLPDKAIDVIDAAGARQRVKPADQKKTVLDASDIELEVSVIARIPRQTVQEDEGAKLQHLGSDLKSVVFDQDGAVEALEDAIIMARAGLRDRNKPIGSYLFAGPTGVGKTEVAKQLAKTLGLELVRYDMSEYMEKHSVAKLIGAPPGYVGYGEGGAGSGLLINDIEKSPHCVLLLDEIEKAHPDVFNILLQVMDNGTLTSSSGKSVSMKNVILIMTSNAGASEQEKNAIGFGRTERDGEDDKVINATFAPEFRNRLDAVVKFKRLNPATMEKIVEKFLGEMNKLAADKNVTIVLDAAAKKWLAEKGYDPKMGARPLGRVIDQHIKKALSREMLFGSLKDGGIANVTVADDGEKLVIASVKKAKGKKSTEGKKQAAPAAA